MSMKKLLQILGMSLLAITQTSFAQSPAEEEHFVYEGGHLTVDISGYRNSVTNSGELSYKRTDHFSAAEQKCADSQLAELKDAIPKSLAANYSGHLIVQIDISNVPDFGVGHGWSAIEVKAPYLYLRPNFDPTLDICEPYPSLTLVTSLNTMVAKLPADQDSLAKSLKDLDTVMAPPVLPGQVTVTGVLTKQEQAKPDSSAQPPAPTANSGGAQ